jgi:hypothetical protein
MTTSHQHTAGQCNLLVCDRKVAPPTCDICSRPATRRRTDGVGFKHRACDIHACYLGRWVREANREARCEGAAARDFEDRAYGRD